MEACLEQISTTYSEAHSRHMDPLSIAGSIAGLVALGGQLVSIAHRIGNDFPDEAILREVADTQKELQSFVGILQRIDAVLIPSEQEHGQDGITQSFASDFEEVVKDCTARPLLPGN